MISQLLERLPVFRGLWHIHVSTASDQPKGLPEGLIFMAAAAADDDDELKG